MSKIARSFGGGGGGFHDDTSPPPPPPPPPPGGGGGGWGVVVWSLEFVLSLPHLQVGEVHEHKGCGGE